MISIDNITKSFGLQVLFDEVSFKINSKERVGLVGRNGHGKTTLFKMIIGQEHPDAGNVTIPKNYRIGYVQQELLFTKDTVLKEGMTGLLREERDHHWKVAKILAGLGFTENDLQRHPEEFSGGYQVRLNLAKVLVSEPDLLLLDEPTNYLDITSIRWVERFLSNWPRELMLITHDRGLMDKLVTHTLGIHRRKIRKIAGDTGKYYNQIAMEEELHEKTRIKDERRRKQIENFIARFRAKARLVNLVQSRIKTLAKAEKKEKLAKIKALDFAFRSKPFHGKYVMIAKDVGFSYDPLKPIIKNFSISIASGDRICIVGQNGKGKTTLLKLMSKMLEPQQGEITFIPAVSQGVFEQTNLKNLVESRTIEEEILFSYSDIDRQQARDICGAMMFEGDAAEKKIAVLSGGEKSRVMLGKILAVPVNVLLLDEPTNHFDMESCDALLAAIDNFDGTVIMVTHNEMFLHALAQRLIVFQNDGVRVFEGGYQRFLEKGGWEDEGDSTAVETKDAHNKTSRSKLTKKEIRRLRSEFVTERARVLKPLEQSIIRTENDIEAQEETLDKLGLAMQSATQAQDGAKIAQIAQAIHRCRSDIDRLFNELEEITDTFEEQKAIFQKKMKQL